MKKDIILKFKIPTNRGFWRDHKILRSGKTLYGVVLWINPDYVLLRIELMFINRVPATGTKNVYVYVAV